MTKSLRLALALISVAFVLSISIRPGAAAAAAVKDDVAGTWSFVLNTPGGDRTSIAQLKLDGANVSGTWGEKTEVKGTFTDGTLDLAFTLLSPEAGEGTLKIKGKLAGDEINGDWEFQTYNGTFKATRSK